MVAALHKTWVTRLLFFRQLWNTDANPVPRSLAPAWPWYKASSVVSWFYQGFLATWQSPFPPLFSCTNKVGCLSSDKVMLPLSSIGTMHPSDFHDDLQRFRYLIRRSWRPPRHRYGSPALDNLTSDTCRPCYPDGSQVWLPLTTYLHYGLPYTDTR
jgi:hypothetical protein